MDCTNCISEVLGIVKRCEIIKYVEKNWRTINYETTIENLLKKFEESLVKNRGEKSVYTEKYQAISEKWKKFQTCLKQYGKHISGHFDDCEGNPNCRCSLILFISPRETLCEIVNAYYPVRCILVQIDSYCSYEEVADNFNKNWRRMDLKNTLKGVLKILFSIDPVLHDKLLDFYEMNKFKDPAKIDHSTYDCEFVFDEFGVCDCECTNRAYRRGPLHLINSVVREIYDKRDPTL